MQQYRQGAERHRPPQWTEVEADLQRALAVACQQQATALEVRAAMSLGRLWQHQGKPARARRLLADICGRFPEGHDSAGVHDAQRLCRVF